MISNSPNTTSASRRRSARQILLRYVLLTVGGLIYAAGIALFLDPNHLAPGGVSGIAIIIHQLWGRIRTGTWIILLNVPIMLLGWRKFGFRFICSTCYTLLFSSAAMNVMNRFSPNALTDDPLLACVAGSALVSVGIGIVFRAGGTTGGTDIIVKLLRSRLRYLNTGIIFSFVDGTVVLCSWLVFGNIDSALYAAIAVMLQTIILDRVLYGGDEARLVYIISEKKDVICRRLLIELETGVTFLEGRGAYSGKEREVILVTVRMRSLPEVRDIVAEEDRTAFMVVTSATSVFGEGYRDHGSDDI